MTSLIYTALWLLYCFTGRTSSFLSSPHRLHRPDQTKCTHSRTTLHVTEHEDLIAALGTGSSTIQHYELDFTIYGTFWTLHAYSYRFDIHLIFVFHIMAGEPVPLQRHRCVSWYEHKLAWCCNIRSTSWMVRIARGIMFNPSAKEQKLFLKESEAFMTHKEPLTGQLACQETARVVIRSKVTQSMPLPLAWLALDRWPPGPLEATMYFYFSRPKYHFGTGKKAGILKKVLRLPAHHRYHALLLSCKSSCTTYTL